MRVIACSLLCYLALTFGAAPAFAQPDMRVQATCPTRADPQRDGQHDFDFEIGEWRTHLWYLQNPLSGEPPRWVEYQGVSNVRAILDERANLVELSVEGAPGKIEGMSLRLYDPQARQWNLNFASIRAGQLTTPVIGAFSEGCGEFYGQDTLSGGRTILVRFVIQQTSHRAARFEQAFSADGGRTWELNWIATDTRR